MKWTLFFSIRLIAIALVLVRLTEGKQLSKERGEAWFRVDLTDFVRYLFPLLSRFIVENEMDELPIPGAGQSFWIAGPRLLLPVIHGEVTYSFSSGSLHRLSTLKRYGTIAIAYRGDTLNVDANVAFHSILLTYDYFVRVLLLKQQGKVFVDATSIWVNVDIEFDIFNRDLTLKKLRLINIESIAISANGSALMELIVTPLGNIVTSLIKNTLIREIEERVTALFREYLRQTSQRLCSRGERIRD